MSTELIPILALVAMFIAATVWPVNMGALGFVAASLVLIFGGHTHALIPLYAVGVFIDFTIAQGGMIRHWLRQKSPGWRRRLAINAIGCISTAAASSGPSPAASWGCARSGK